MGAAAFGRYGSLSPFIVLQALAIASFQLPMSPPYDSVVEVIVADRVAKDAEWIKGVCEGVMHEVEE
jgi:hypothetical protein